MEQTAVLDYTKPPFAPLQDINMDENIKIKHRVKAISMALKMYIFATDRWRLPTRKPKTGQPGYASLFPEPYGIWSPNFSGNGGKTGTPKAGGRSHAAGTDHSIKNYSQSVKTPARQNFLHSRERRGKEPRKQDPGISPASCGRRIRRLWRLLPPPPSTSPAFGRSFCICRIRRDRREETFRQLCAANFYPFKSSPFKERDV